MKAVILRFSNKLNGVVIDAIEHFLFVREHGHEVRLVFVTELFADLAFLDDVLDLITSRYKVTGDVSKDIRVELKTQVRCTQYTNVLLCGAQDLELIPSISTDSLTILQEEVWIEDTQIGEKWYCKLPGLEKARVFTEYGSSGEVTPALFAFDLYKEKVLVPKSYYMVGLGTKGSSEIIDDLLHDEDIEEIQTYGTEEIFKDPRVKTNPFGIKDIFNSFGTYIYDNDLSFFDPRPRLFVECQYYNKDVKVHRISTKDGAWNRWNDFNTLTRDELISKRNMTLESPVIKHFLT